MFVQKYLVRQTEIGFDEFRLRYGKLAYNKVDSDEPAPEVEVIEYFRCWTMSLKLSACYIT